MRWTLRIVGCVALAAGLGGCYGSTEPATDVSETRATLHAQGHANNGDAYSLFEYWRTAQPGIKFSIGRWHWPAGAKSTFQGQLTHLAPARSYSFRLCGGDEANPGQPVCANTRTFTTSTPTGDVASGGVHLFGPGPGISVSFEAFSGPSGQNPSGYAQGDVTCLSVSGSQATIGSDTQSRDGMLIWAREDPPGSGSGHVTFSVDLPTPVDCSTPVGGAGSPLSGDSDHVAVWDSSSPTARR